MENVLHFIPSTRWFGDFEYFKSRIEDLLYIGFQESLNTDFAEIIRILGIPESPSLPTDNVAAHKNPEGLDKTIEAREISALTDWYSGDIKFISVCKEIMSHKKSQ